MRDGHCGATYLRAVWEGVDGCGTVAARVTDRVTFSADTPTFTYFPADFSTTDPQTDIGAGGRAVAGVLHGPDVHVTYSDTVDEASIVTDTSTSLQTWTVFRTWKTQLVMADDGCTPVYGETRVQTISVTAPVPEYVALAADKTGRFLGVDTSSGAAAKPVVGKTVREMWDEVKVSSTLRYYKHRDLGCYLGTQAAGWTPMGTTQTNIITGESTLTPTYPELAANPPQVAVCANVKVLFNVTAVGSLWTPGAHTQIDDAIASPQRVVHMHHAQHGRMRTMYQGSPLTEGSLYGLYFHGYNTHQPFFPTLSQRTTLEAQDALCERDQTECSGHIVKAVQFKLLPESETTYHNSPSFDTTAPTTQLIACSAFTGLDGFPMPEVDTDTDCATGKSVTVRSAERTYDTCGQVMWKVQFVGHDAASCGSEAAVTWRDFVVQTHTTAATNLWEYFPEDDEVQLEEHPTVATLASHILPETRMPNGPATALSPCGMAEGTVTYTDAVVETATQFNVTRTWSLRTSIDAACARGLLNRDSVQNIVALKAPPTNIEAYACNTKAMNVWPTTSHAYLYVDDCLQNPWKCALDGTAYDSAATGLVQMLRNTSDETCAAACRADYTAPCRMVFHDTVVQVCFMHSHLASGVSLQYERFVYDSPPSERFSVQRTCYIAPYLAPSVKPTVWAVSAASGSLSSGVVDGVISPGSRWNAGHESGWNVPNWIVFRFNVRMHFNRFLFWCSGDTTHDVKNWHLEVAETGTGPWVEVAAGVGAVTRDQQEAAFAAVTSKFWRWYIDDRYSIYQAVVWEVDFGFTAPPATDSPPTPAPATPAPPTPAPTALSGSIADYPCNVSVADVWPLESSAYVGNGDCTVNPWKCALTGVAFDSAATGLISHTNSTNCAALCLAEPACNAVLMDSSIDACFLHSDLSMWTLQYEQYTLVNPPLERFSVQKVCRPTLAPPTLAPPTPSPPTPAPPTPSPPTPAPPTPVPTPSPPTPAPPGAASYIGCYVDTGVRDFQGAHSAWTHASVELCSKFCFSTAPGAPYLYMGLQNGNECYCDNSYGMHGSVADAECWKPCVQDSSQDCGAAWRNSVYLVGVIAPTDPPPTPAPGVASYIGCYVDTGVRDLPGAFSAVTHASVELCSKFCFSTAPGAPYLYMGLQNGNECFCDNSYGRHGSVADAECWKPCVQDSSQKCGAGWRNSVYLVGVVAPTDAPASDKPAVYSYSSYSGDYNGIVDGITCCQRGWDPSNPGWGNPHWVVFEFAVAAPLNTFSFWSSGDTTHDTKNWHLDTGVTATGPWVQVASGVGAVTDAEQVTTFTTTTSKFYRFYISDRYSYYQAFVREVDFALV